LQDIAAKLKPDRRPKRAGAPQIGGGGMTVRDKSSRAKVNNLQFTRHGA
jgi:hypothetical protein